MSEEWVLFFGYIFSVNSSVFKGLEKVLVAIDMFLNACEVLYERSEVLT